MTNLFAATGAVLIMISIATAWLIVARRYLSLGVATRYIRDDEKLVKAHVDYLMMGLVLLIFYAVGMHFPSCLVVLACLGALTDPSLFVFLALKPDVNKKLGSPFSVISTISFLAATVGIGGVACLILAEMLALK
ncbi:MAG TPA: hypothetical protein PLT45_02650 [Smithella sp.]|nr:hypothetical protein [Smithella sp.]